MTDTRSTALVRLGDTDLTVADPAEDIRGRTVVDTVGREIGEVDGLLIDTQEAKVRLLEVASGGFLGIGKDKTLIPVDAIAKIDGNNVHLGQTSEHVAGAPDYDPSLAADASYFRDLYGYYGVTPFWGMGYVYPAYPYYRMR